MIVVADTSPLNYLILIDEADLLPTLFGQVILPKEVVVELQDVESPDKVRQWIAQVPNWIEVQSASSQSINPALQELDAGEQEAIQLALDLRADMVLIDEIDGRKAAQSLHLNVRGTLGILELAAQSGKVNFRDALSKLEQTSFRMSAALREQFLRRNP